MSEIAILSKLVQAVALRDTTVPPSWDLDAVLRGVEELLIRQMRRPDLFTDICHGALAGVTNPYALALIRLGQLNGTRRIDSVAPAWVLAKYQTCQQEIGDLAPDPRKTRLQSFLIYQGRVFMAKIGEYEQAARLEEEEVGAAVREAEKSVSRFLARLYHIWHTLCSGAESEEREDLYYLLRRMQLATRGTNLEVLWGLGNGPIHMLQVLLFTDRMKNHVWIECLSTVRQHHDELPPGLWPWITIMGAADWLGNGELDGAAESLDNVPDTAPPDVQAAVLLVRARIARATNNIGAAREIYLTIEPVPNGHMIAAQATRELAALTGAPSA